jgi:hypothetical protein
MEYLIILMCLMALVSVVIWHTINFSDTTPQNRQQKSKIEEKSSYQDYKKRLQEEIAYSNINPWRKPAKVLQFPMHRVKRKAKK